jgi:hypothetical protein
MLTMSEFGFVRFWDFLDFSRVLIQKSINLTNPNSDSKILLKTNANPPNLNLRNWLLSHCF